MALSNSKNMPNIFFCNESIILDTKCNNISFSKNIDLDIDNLDEESINIIKKQELYLINMFPQTIQYVKTFRNLKILSITEIDKQDQINKLSLKHNNLRYYVKNKRIRLEILLYAFLKDNTIEIRAKIKEINIYRVPNINKFSFKNKTIIDNIFKKNHV